MKLSLAMRSLLVAALLCITFGARIAIADDIAIANYGVAMNGMPFAIAISKGYFKEEGAPNITGIMTDSGGGTTIRNLTAGDLLYGESSLAAVVSAIQSGADIKIISEDASLVTDICFVTMPNSPIKSINDIKGKRLGFTNPGSTTQALTLLLLEKVGLKPSDVTMTAAGGFGPGLTALENGGLDVMALTDPLTSKYGDKYRVVAWAKDLFPPMNNVVGISTAKAMKEHPDTLKAIIRARRKGAEFMNQHPKEAAEIIASIYKMEPAVIENAIKNTGVTVQGVTYWGTGKINYQGLDNMIRAQKLVGAVKGDVDWSKIVDESFLPDDLKSKK
jgi:NitT/TauT family transport system substrate-binding protein